MSQLTISRIFNIILIILYLLSWFKIPEMLLEHYKSHLANINQKAEEQFRQHIQYEQQKFESNLQKSLAEQERNFQQKSDLLKHRRAIIPIIYTKLLTLRGIVKEEDINKKRKKQIEINNYIETQRLFLDKSTFDKIKAMQKSLNTLITDYETTNNPTVVGPQLEKPNKEIEQIESELDSKFQVLETDFQKVMFDSTI